MHAINYLGKPSPSSSPLRIPRKPVPERIDPNSTGQDHGPILALSPQSGSFQPKHSLEPVPGSEFTASRAGPEYNNVKSSSPRLGEATQTSVEEEEEEEEAMNKECHLGWRASPGWSQGIPDVAVFNEEKVSEKGRSRSKREPDMPSTDITSAFSFGVGRSKDIIGQEITEVRTRTPHKENALRSDLPPPSWKPLSFHWGYFLLLLALHGTQIGLLLHVLERHLSLSADQHEALSAGSIANFLASSHEAPETAARGFIFSTTNSAALFLWQFFPVIFGVFHGSLWAVVESTVRRLEPFYQMSRPNGATVHRSLGVDYGSTSIFYVPIKGLLLKQPTVVLASLIYIIAFLILPLVLGLCWKIEWAREHCFVVISQATVFAAIGLNTLCIVLAATLLALITLRRTGLYSDPSSIASLVSLIADSSIIEEFRQIPEYETQERINELLSSRKFYLRHVWVQRNRINPAYHAYQIVSFQMPGAPDSLKYVRQKPFKQRALEAEPLVLQWASKFIILLLFVLPLILLRVSYIRRFSVTPSQIKAVLFLLSSFASSLVLQAQWAFSIIEPFQILLTPQPFSKLSLSFTSPFIFSSVRSRRILPILLSIWASISLINTAILPPLVDSIASITLYPPALQNARDGLSYIYWPLNAIGILIALYFIYARHQPILPRAPITLSSQILYLCNSPRLLGIMSGMSLLEDRQRKEVLQKVEYRERAQVGLGWFVPVGEERWKVGVELGVRQKWVYGSSDERSRT